MRSVLLITFHFPPSPTVGGHRALRMARFLPECGYRVEVVTTEPSGEARIDTGLSKLVPEATRVHRLPVRHFLGRDSDLVPEAHEVFGRAWWKLRAYTQDLVGPPESTAPWAKDARRRAQRLLATGEFDVVLVSCPPFSPAVEALVLKRRANVPVVVDFRDLWITSVMTDEEGGTPEPVPWYRLYRHLRQERRLVDHADRVVFNNREAMDRMLLAYPRLRSKSTFVTNGYDGDVVREPPADKAAGTQRGTLTLTHTGQLAYGRDVSARTLVAAVRRLVSDGNAPPLRLLFVGAERGMVEAIAKEAGAEDLVETVGWTSRDESVELQRRADVLVILQADVEGNRYCVPAKLYEYMTARKPILGVLPKGPAASIIVDNDLGAVGDWSDVESVHGALRDLVARTRAGASPEPPEQYSARETMRKLAGVLDDVLGSAGEPTDVR